MPDSRTIVSLNADETFIQFASKKSPWKHKHADMQMGPAFKKVQKRNSDTTSNSQAESQESVSMKSKEKNITKSHVPVYVQSSNFTHCYYSPNVPIPSKTRIEENSICPKEYSFQKFLFCDQSKKIF